MGAAKTTPEVTQCHHPRTVARTRVYKAIVTPKLLADITACWHKQRGVYNLTIASLNPEGGDVPALRKTPRDEDALLRWLTEERARTAWLRAIPLTTARPAVAEARGAAAAHEAAVCARIERLLDEERAWDRWMAAHPDWDSGAWDALSAEDKRKAIRARRAPPRSVSTWRDERGDDGGRACLFKHRKQARGRTVTSHTPPRRVDANTLSVLGINVGVVAKNGLPDAERLLSCRLCMQPGRSGRTRVQVHLSVRIDVPRPRARKRTRIIGGDLACAETVRWHTGRVLRLPDPEEWVEKAHFAQQATSRCSVGSRKWNDWLECHRRARRRVRGRDVNAIRKTAAAMVRRWHVAGMEDLPIAAMGTSARARGRVGVEAKRRLSRRMRAALWGETQRTFASTFEAAGRTFVKVIAVDSSRTCAECGHVDPRNRSGETFQCTWCGHTDHADTNAARVVRARTARWLVLREVHQSDARAHEALRSIVYQMRRASKVRALVAREKLPRAGKTREGARTKPRAEGAVGNTQHNGAKGVASSAPRLRDHARSGSRSSTAAEPAVRHEQCSQRSV